jgi:hypothetical protein
MVIRIATACAGMLRDMLEADSTYNRHHVLAALLLIFAAGKIARETSGSRPW